MDLKLCWSTQKRKIKDLIPYDKNPRKLTTEQEERLTQSLSKFNIAEIPAVNTDGTIIAGHQRVKILLKLNRGEEEIDVRVPSRKLTDEEYKEYNLRSNKNTGEWDLDLLAEFDEEMLMDVGFDKDELEEIFKIDLEPEEKDDAIPEVRETDIVLGDMFQLGEHRLICGDATKVDDVEKLMQGEKADMVFTDPPYRMDALGGSNDFIGRTQAKLGEKIKDIIDFEPEEFLQTIPTVFNSKKMNAYVFCNKDLVPDYLNWAIKSGYNFNILFWKKPNAVPLGGTHRPDVEYVLLFRKSAIWNNSLKDVNYSRCLEYGRENSTPHPTMKPVELITNEIQISSNKGSFVMDFFGGSGSTLIACEKTNRKCRMLEIDPSYCQVIIDRYEEFSGNKAVKI